MSVPTSDMETELRKLYMRFTSSIDENTADITDRVQAFNREAASIIKQHAEDVRPEGFPAPSPITVSIDMSTVTGVLENALTSAGIAAGMNAREIARAMRGAGIAKTWTSLETLARTEVVQAYWRKSWESAGQYVRDGSMQMVWSAEQGPRTCPFCLAKNGMVVKDPTVVDHPRGRCTLIPRLTHTMDPVNPPALSYQPDWLRGRDEVWDSSPLRELGPSGVSLAQAFGSTLDHSLLANVSLQRELGAIIGEGKTIKDARLAVYKALTGDDFHPDRATDSLVNGLLATRATSLWQNLTPDIPKTLYRGGRTGAHVSSWTTSAVSAGRYAMRKDGVILEGVPRGAVGYNLGGEQREWLIRGTFLPQAEPRRGSIQHMRYISETGVIAS